MENFSLACNASISGVPGELFTLLISKLFAAQCALARSEDYPNDYGDRLIDGEEFDFIVVGAGIIFLTFFFVPH